MGGSESKKQVSTPENEPNIPTDPLINRLRSTFRLKISDKEHNKTHSFIHSFFSQQMIKNNGDKINPNFSPFCSIFSSDPKKPFVITCVLISPIMMMSPSANICDDSGFIFLRNITVQGVLNNNKIKRKVKNTVLLKDNTLVLLILETPLWQLGWCGLSYLEESEDINTLPCHLIKNNMLQDGKHTYFQQKLSRVLCTDEGGFMGKSASSDYGLIFQIVQRKPYIKGLMIETLCFFFDLSFIEKLQDYVKEYLKPEMERDFLKEIDLEQMQIQTSW